MRKFISAAIAFAMTATAMAGMTVASAEGTGTDYLAWPSIIGGPNQDKTNNNNTAVVQYDTGAGSDYVKYWAKNGYKALSAFDLGKVNNGDEINVTVTYRVQNAHTTGSVDYYILSDEVYNTLKTTLTSYTAVNRFGYYNDGRFATDVGSSVASKSLENVANSKVAYNTPTAINAETSGHLIAYISLSSSAEKSLLTELQKFNVAITSADPDPEPTDKYFTVSGNVDKAGTYKKVNVTANNGEKDATATADITGVENGLTLEAGASVSIGIKVTDIPDGKTVTIKSITLE